jgi:hypothetical protein
MMDNRLFNVNGKGDEMLLKALQLAFLQFSDRCGVKAWEQSKEHGLVLCWSSNTHNVIPTPGELTAEQALPMVKSWLASDFAKTVELSDWCSDADHDGHNSIGWQVYCGDWGHVGGQHYAICAIKPAYMWHGK